MKKIYIWSLLVVLIIVAGIVYFYLSNTKPLIPVAEETYSTSSTNPYFQTYTNTTLGFSIDIPKTVYSDVAGCRYETTNEYTGQPEPSYRFAEGTSSIPIAVYTNADSAYIDFAYYYDLIQKENGSPDYSACVKRDISDYMKSYLASIPNGTSSTTDYSGPNPIIISIQNVNDTSDLQRDSLFKKIEAVWPWFSSSCPFSVQITPPTSGGVSNVYLTLPQNYTEPEDGTGGCSGNTPIIEYSSQTKKLAIIIDEPQYQYCPFSRDGTPQITADPGCYNPTIDSSFRFLP